MTTRVLHNTFAADPEPPYDMARHILGPILPDDRLWEVNFSSRECQFNCLTKIPSQKTKGRDTDPLELGVNLRFKITKDNELYASELLPSQKFSTQPISGQTYSKLKRELLLKLTKRWRTVLKASGIRTDF